MEAASLSTPGRSPFSISPPTPDSCSCRFLLPVRPDGTAARPRRTPSSTGGTAPSVPAVPGGGADGYNPAARPGSLPMSWLVFELCLPGRALSPPPPPGPSRAAGGPRCGSRPGRDMLPGGPPHSGSRICRRSRQLRPAFPADAATDAGAAFRRVSVGGAGHAHAHAHAARHAAVAGPEKPGRRRDGNGVGEWARGDWRLPGWQRAECPVATRKVPAPNPHPRGLHPVMGAVTAQTASRRTFLRTRRRSCFPPTLAANILLIRAFPGWRNPGQILSGEMI